MSLDRILYENRIKLLMSRKRDNGNIIKKLQRKLHNLG